MYGYIVDAASHSAVAYCGWCCGLSACCRYYSSCGHSVQKVSVYNTSLDKTQANFNVSTHAQIAICKCYKNSIALFLCTFI